MRVLRVMLIIVLLVSLSAVWASEEDSKPQLRELCITQSVPPLHTAVSNESMSDVAELLEKGEDPNITDDCGQTALHVAAGILKGNRKLVELLISSGADLNARTNNGATPLDVLFYIGGIKGFDWSIVRLLYNPKVPARCSLQAAVMAGDLKLVQEMIKSKTDIDGRECSWATPVYLAIEEQQWKIVKYLVIEGADLNQGNGANRPNAKPLHAAVEAEEPGIAKLLLKHGANVDTHSMSGSPLHWAARIGSIKMAKLLLKHGANLEELTGTAEYGRRTHENAAPNFSSDSTAGNESPLHIAAGEGNARMVTFLLSQVADIQAQNATGQNALFFAVMSSSLSTVKELIQAGLSVNSSDKKQRTPLHYAALGGGKEIVAYLLDHGADINTRDQARLTVLHWAAAYGQSEVCKLLLERGADSKAKDEAGKTPLDYARKWAWDTPWNGNREDRQQEVISILSNK